MQILVVDDELSMREYLDVLLTQEGYEVRTAPSANEAIAALGERPFDLVISDMRLKKESGLAVLRSAKALPSAPEVILITAYGTPESAVQAMREGAYDYICKPFDNEELKLLVQRALEKRGLIRENRELKDSLAPAKEPFVLGSSPAIREVWSLVEKVAATRSTVLISGESGTGKELIARAIHLKGGRAGQPFLPVNCAALAEGVLESELFGHVKGAYTGAIGDRSGLLVSAGDGTVFLDEIGEVTQGMQVKLLRVLQERKVKPVGSSQEVSFSARILAATNKRLDEEVRAGRFREDLWYRLNVITIDMPALRRRPGDIALLAKHFLESMGRELDRPALRFSEEALGFLERYAFPGNVRQLQNIVERAATLSEGDLLGAETLPPAVRGESEPRGDSRELALGSGTNLEKLLDQTERRHLIAALEQAGGIKKRAAELLGLTFRSFRYRLAKHGLAETEESVD